MSADERFEPPSLPIDRAPLPSRSRDASRDQLFIDAGIGIEAGISGELLVARVRIVLLLILLVVQFIPNADPMYRRVSLPLNGVALILALVFHFLARRVTKPWLGLVSSATDVTLVSIGLAAFLYFDQPLAAVNSRSLFEVYFLAIGCASLRYDWRVSVLTGVLAVTQYGLIVGYAVTHWNLADPRFAPYRVAMFDWTVTGSRFVLLAAAAVLSAFVVLRAQRLQRMTAVDQLTGVFNRSAFEQHLSKEVDRARRYARPFAVAILDVDHFKRFNDTHGHMGGDAVLRAVAQTLRRSVRKSDFVARFGGEEFALILPETSAELVVGKLEGLRRAVADAKIVPGKRKRPVGVTVSIGVASWPDDGAGIDDVVACADERLYEAKRRGRDRTVGPPTPRAASSAPLSPR